MTDETQPAAPATVSVNRAHQWIAKRNNSMRVCARCGTTYPPTRPFCYVEEVPAADG